MIKINLRNLFPLPNPYGIVQTEFQNSEKKLPELLQKVLNRKQGFYEILDENEIIQNIETFCHSRTGKYSDIVVLGIGGSALGTLALYNALKPILPKSAPRLHVLDNIDPEQITQLTESLDLKKSLFLVVTKSGKTPETIAEYFFFRDKIENTGLNIKDHFVFITDPHTGFLREEAQKENIPSFPIPENVGGRFSVLTSVGLVPACLVGINIREILTGAKTMREKFLSEDFEKNIPFQFAVIQFLLAQRGKTQHVFMPYTNALCSFSSWWAQLLAESTGKINKSQKNVGITPLSCTGATDQHSLLQLFMQGPNDKFIVFLTREKWNANPIIPALTKNTSWEFLQDISFAKLLNAEQKATADSLTEEKRPNITLTLSQISPETLGELFFFFQSAQAFLGELLEIDAFNQPGVERSKTLTRKYLS